MISNQSLLNQRVGMFNKFLEENSHLPNGFKTDHCKGVYRNYGSYKRFSFHKNSSIIKSFVDWGFLKVVGIETGEYNTGRYENQVVIQDQSGFIYKSFEEVPRNVLVTKVFRSMPIILPTTRNLYGFVDRDFSNNNLIKMIGRKIFNSTK